VETVSVGLLETSADFRSSFSTFISQELIDKMAEKNVLALRLGPGKHLHGRTILDGAVEGDKVDFFHDMIVGQELTRPAARGFQVIPHATGFR